MKGSHIKGVTGVRQGAALYSGYKGQDKGPRGM